VSKIIQKKTRIVLNIHLTGDYYKLVLNLPEIARCARPGQFVMLRVANDYQPLLRRPFSIHSVNNGKSGHNRGQIEILYQVVGRGTEILSEKKPGEYLDVLGPLGNGFSILDSRYSLLVGGGMGVAPLLFLAQELSTVNRQLSTVLIGAKTKRALLSKKEFANLGLRVKISTDDGSAGFEGKATDLLKYLLSTLNSKPSTIYACGPKSMLKEIAIISKQYHIPAQISLEEYMACGLGVCLGCMVKTKSGYQAVCKEGPVFDSSRIIW
jgi:dihydroorotate dehydrogenase electron transfer subunit